MEDKASFANRWSNFFNAPAVWKAFLLTSSYLGVYLAAGLIVTEIASSNLTLDNLLDNPSNIFLGLTLPIAIGALLLVLFGKSVGWLRPVFAKQPVGGKKWMWIAPILVLLAIALRLASADYGAFTPASLLMIALTGVFIGLAEELIARGYIVKMLRDAGKSEWSVMVLSSFLFAIMHSANVLSGQSIGITLVQLLFTFGFGICMYVTLRATGHLIYPIMLHALYDPTLFISTGGISNVADDKLTGLAALGGAFTIIFLIFALIALIFVRGRTGQDPQHSV